MESAPEQVNVPTTWAALRRKLAIFVLALSLADLAAGSLLRWIHPRVHTGQVVGYPNAALHAGADVLIFGPSTAVHHYDDQLLTELLGVRVFNAGSDGRGLPYARGLLAMIGQIHPPKLVVVDICYFGDEWATARILAPFYGRNPTVDQILVNGDWRNWVKLHSLSYRFNGAPLAMLVNLDRPYPKWGFEGLGGSLLPNSPLDDAPRDAPGLGSWFEVEIERLVQTARAQGARVLFVESPVWGRRLAPEVIEQYRRVSEREHVPFFRATVTDRAELDHAELFRDARHLNRTGARVFSGLLAPELARELAPANP
jgi:hypothetical protein